MAVYEGTYPSLLQGVSQQTPQERLDGQLGAQVNMLSDPVTGLRRRTGFSYYGTASINPNAAFSFWQVQGEYFIQAVEPSGRLVVVSFKDKRIIHDSKYPYLAFTGTKSVIRSAISRGQVYILNTEKVPNKVNLSSAYITKLTASENLRRQWVTYGRSILLTAATVTDSLRIQVGSAAIDVTVTVNHTDGIGEFVSGQTRASRMYAAILANPTLAAYYTVSYSGVDISLLASTAGQASILTTSISVGTSYAYTSSMTVDRSRIATYFPSTYNGYYYTTGGVTYIYDATRKLWTEGGTVPTEINPHGAGWVRITSGAFAKTYTVSILQGASATLTYSITTSTSAANQATPEYVAEQLRLLMVADTAFTATYTVVRNGTTLGFTSSSSASQLIIDVSGGDTYIQSSDSGRVADIGWLPPALPDSLDGYIQGVGDWANLAYYRYNHSTRSWSECGAYETRYVVQNTPLVVTYNPDVNGIVVENSDINGRIAGNDDNNPEPQFIGFGITGISAYQSRLVYLSGSFVNMSKSADPRTFMRSTVTELLDDDPIEISATALSSAQFEYAIPYNKDLVLFSQTQQAVIPSSTSVLTPKNAAIYPSTQFEVSLSAAPTVVARSLYYVYQRGADYYQVGEVIPNQYTDSQYYPQNLTDHIPLYAHGTCTNIAGSSTNNMVAFNSENNEILINQFLWGGDTRNLMGFHKWTLPNNVLHVEFLQEYMAVLVEDNGKVTLLTTNTQLNQLDNRPVPYLDFYQYVTITGGVGVAPTYLPDGELVGVIYDDINMRHKEVTISVDGNVLSCSHDGVIAVGLRYDSSFTLTPPYIKDQNGKVLAGVRSTVHSFPLTFKGTSTFKYTVSDFVGLVSDVETAAPVWAEVDLGYNWINSISTHNVPCRSRLNGLTCSISTDSTSDLNLITAGYVLRTAQKHKQFR